MDKDEVLEYVKILEEELVPALGCTEPIALAFAASRARKILGTLPEKIVVECSGNIIKNVMGVVVPNSGGQKGVAIASIIGAVGGDSDKLLETLNSVTEDDIAEARKLLNTKDYCTVKLLEGVENLHIKMNVFSKDDSVLVEIAHSHTNIILEKKNDTILFVKDEQASAAKADRSKLSLESLFDFATNVDLALVKDLLKKQIEYNTKIANEGMKNSYGANIGKTLIKHYGNDIKVRAKALAAAGSDARMNGCVLPVVINSGSGNQGLTVSLPIIEFASEYSISEELLYRSLLISNLVSIYQKSRIGKLSAFCGAVSAASGCGAGITYMLTQDFEKVCRTIINTLGNVSGIVCDGAKSSCAAKIASSVDAAIMAHYMSEENYMFNPKDGVIKENADSTMKVIGRLAKDGMRQTDVEILNIMIET